MFPIPLAYKFVAVSVMLAEINFAVKQLQLPAEQPIRMQSLELAHVSNPFVTGFGGTLETSTYSFVFFKSGKLRRIVRINRFENIPLRELQRRQADMPSLINTNEAYQLATNWLEKISIDVAALEKQHGHFVSQSFFYPEATDLGDDPVRRKQLVLLPIFRVCWGDKDRPVVWVSIFGATKEMLSMHQEDDAFSRRPRELLSNVEELLAIPDDAFLKYSTEQRRRLVERFAAVHYPTNLNTGSDSNLLVYPQINETK